MPLVLDKFYPSVPFVERGKRVILDAHPKGGFIVYPNKKNVIIRDLSSKMDNDSYVGHSFDVQCAKYAPSGFYVASGDKSGKLHIWDTTQKEHILKNEFPILGSIIDVCWSSDNQRIGVGGVGAERFGKVINAEMGTEVGEISGMSKAINSIDMKPTRPFRLVTGSEDFTACYFEGPPFKLNKILEQHTNFVQCCKFSPKGDIFVTAGSDGKIFVYDAATGELKGEIASPAHKGGIYGLDFSPSGSRIVSVSADKTIKIWNATSPYDQLAMYAFEDKLENMQLGCVWTVGKIVSLGLSGAMSCFDVTDDCSELASPCVLFGHSRPIQRACYSASSNLLLTTSYDGLMIQWNLTTGQALPFDGKEEAHKSEITGVVTSGDRVATVGVDDRLVLSSISKRKYEQSTKLATQPRALCLASAKQLAVAVCLKHLYLFSLADNASFPPVACDVSAEATTGSITSCGNLFGLGKADGSINLFVVENGKSLKQVPNCTEKMAGECTTMAFSPDGGYLAVGDSERYLRLYQVADATSGSPRLTQVNTWRSHAARVTCVAWSPDGRHLATGGLDCAIIVFKPTEASKFCEVRNAHPANLITALVWKSNTELVSTGQDACVRSWKLI